MCLVVSVCRTPILARCCGSYSRSSDFYQQMGKKLNARIVRHRDLIAGASRVKDKEKILLQTLLYYDHDVAMAILWLIIDPVKFQPNHVSPSPPGILCRLLLSWIRKDHYILLPFLAVWRCESSRCPTLVCTL